MSRHFFEPLIDMIRETMAVVHVGGAGFDYRMLAAVKSGASERDAEQEAHLEGERTDVRSVCDEEAAYPGAGSSERAAGRGEGRGRVGSEERRGTSSISGPWGHISGKMGNGPIEGSLRSSLMTRAGIPATGALFKGVNAWQRVDDALGRLVRAAEEFGGGRGPRSVPVGFGRDLRLPECVFVAGRQGAGLVRERRGEGEEGGSSGRGFLAAVVGFEELLGRRGVDGSGPLGPSDMVALVRREAFSIDQLQLAGTRCVLMSGVLSVSG